MDGMTGGGLWSLLVLLTVVGLLIGSFLAGVLMERMRTPGPSDEARQLLRRRLAAGEIDEDEYLRRLAAIESQR